MYSVFFLMFAHLAWAETNCDPAGFAKLRDFLGGKPSSIPLYQQIKPVRPVSEEIYPVIQREFVSSPNIQKTFGDPPKNVGKYEANVRNLTAENNATLAKLEAFQPNVSAGRKDALTEEEARKLFQDVKEHPVAGTCAAMRPTYEAKAKGICFGRAFVAQLEALKAGLCKECMVKLWYAGRGNVYEGFTLAGENYSWHVATAIRVKKDDKYLWMVIDPTAPEAELMTTEAWMKMMRESPHNTNDKTVGQQKYEFKLTITDAAKFSPAHNEFPTHSLFQFLDRSSQGYFDDICDYYKGFCTLPGK